MVEAACQVIGDLGLHNFRVRDVAEAAGVSQPLVSHHFRTREEIVTAAFAYADDISNRVISERAARAANAYEEILAWLVGMIDDDPALMISQQMWYEIWFNGSRSDTHNHVARSGQELWLATIEALIAKAQAVGTIAATAPAKDLAMICSATVDGLQPAIRFDFLTNAQARKLVVTATNSILQPREDVAQPDGSFLASS